MANLTETAYYTRRAINWSILGLIIYFMLRISWFLIVVIWLWLFPPKPPPPNHGFSILPKLVFPPVATPSSQLNFTLETLNGRVPVSSPAAAVYFMPKSSANLLGLTRTQNFAKRFGFETDPTQEKKNIYTFKDTSYPLRTLRYDIVSNNFTIRYIWEMDATVFERENLYTEKQSQEISTNTLKNYSLLPDDLKNGITRTTYWRITANTLVPATSQAEADAVRVDFFRRDVNGMPVYTANPNEGNTAFIYTGSKNDKKKLILLQYTFWPIDYTRLATYELKTAEQAWSELISNQGYIAHYPNVGSTATVRSIKLVYYDSLEPQMYLQPIFVFEGDDGFVAYVPAVTPAWTEK